MKIFLLLGFVGMLVDACFGATGSTAIEQQQQQPGVQAIVRNQPIPDLGGWSFEREVVRQTYVARNHVISTWTYMLLEYTGKVVEICESRGYPIPYSTELSNPLQLARETDPQSSAVGNPEPNGLYPPPTANATLVQCVNPDGSVSPTYWENNVFALPYPLKNPDIVLQRADTKSSLSVSVTR